MNKTQFESPVRQKLRRIPVATRQTWNGTDLLAWWLKTANDHPSLTWDKGRGDPWQYVHSMCTDMIGDRVLM
jgi:hypothetical protein